MTTLIPIATLSVALCLLAYVIVGMLDTQKKLKELNYSLKKDKIQLAREVRELDSDLNQLQNEIKLWKNKYNN